MATLTTTPSKSEAFLQRKFAEIAARIHRADILAHLLGLLLFIVSYAFAFGMFEECVGASSAAWVSVSRWLGFATCCLGVGTLSLLTIRAALRTVNPYFIAQHLEASLPDAKNGLINWLDLHDEELPTAFQKHLGVRAVEQWKDGDLTTVSRSPRVKVLSALLIVPVIGLGVLIAMNASAFAPTMGRAFVPFVAPEATARTRITLLEPAGDVEISADRAIAFSAKIEGRVPGVRSATAPVLHVRHEAGEDAQPLPLQPSSDGVWGLTYPADKIRGGFTYRITAGDATTPEHRVRIRAQAFVTKFTVHYEHRSYRRMVKSTVVFPNEAEPKLAVRGLRGTEVELVCESSRPVKSAAIAIQTEKSATDLLTFIAPDGKSFRARWTLEQSGKLRVTFKTTDGDDNVDRDRYEVDVHADETPRAVLTTPGKDVTLPANGMLELAGEATDDHGVKGMALHVRVHIGPDRTPLVPKAYRSGKSFRFADGSYPTRIAYRDLLALDDLHNANNTRIEFPPGTVLEYWLEATDNSDYPHAAGAIGKSSVYKITLISASKQSGDLQAKRKQAEDQQKQHDKQQDDQHGQQQKGKQQDSPSKKDANNAADPQRDLDAMEKEKKDAEQKIKDALKDQSDRAAAKGSQTDNAQAKPGLSQSPDATVPQSKGDSNDGPLDAGNSKEQGQGMTPALGGHDGGLKPPNGEANGQGKGVEQQGPPTANKDASTSKGPPPDAKSKTAKPPEESVGKGQPSTQSPPPGNARGEERKPSNPKEPGYDDLGKMIDQLPNKDEAGDRAAAALAKAGRDANDPQMRDLIRDALKSNSRDPNTGAAEKKMPNPFGSGSASDGIRDEIQAKAANREFARRLGQLQLDDWRKRLTPERLKNAGLSDADWQRYLKNAAAYDALVQQLNAKQLRDALAKTLRGSASSIKGGAVQSTQPRNDAPRDPTLAAPPLEIRDAVRLFTTPP